MRIPTDISRTLITALLVCSLALLTNPAFAKEKHWGAGISASVAHPYEQVVPIVQEIAQDGVIRGSSQYRGTDQLEGATFVKESNSLPAWKGRGAVFFKVRPDTLAPTHFSDSTEKGTVTVRYIVEPVSANSTNVRIEAVYEEDSHHQSHASDGGVETMEFVAISERFKAIEKAEKQRQEEVAQTQRHKQIEELLQAELHEQAQLESVNNEVGTLEQKIAELQKGRKFRVRTEADLQVAPFKSAQILRPLRPGDMVTVLLQTPKWYQVQTGSGDQGWVYRLMLEAIP